MRLTPCVLAIVSIGCGGGSAANVALLSIVDSTGPEPRLQLRADVSGVARPSELTYEWAAGSGYVQPSPSPQPQALYTFADGMVQDRVILKVQRGERTVGQGELEVRQAPFSPVLQATSGPLTTVEITQVPPYDPLGGPDTRAEIAGRIRGPFASGDRIVIYARAKTWYRQPIADSYHDIRSDSTWASWTHTGSTYAVLLVRRGTPMPAMTDILPAVGGRILARTVVTGLGR